jgi:hypothetical protein
MKILLAPLVIGSMFLLSSCNSSSESNSFDFLKEMHDKYMKARVDGKAEHKSDKELDNEFYSAYEGDKIKLTDFVILAIERVLPQNQAVYNDASGKASPLYRLHLAAMKDIGGKKVGVGGIRLRGGLTYDFFGKPDGQAIDFYDCNEF